jgi:hypothetical protein
MSAKDPFLDHRLHRLLTLLFHKRLVTDGNGDTLCVLSVTTDGMLDVVREGPRKRDGAFLVDPFTVEIY